MSNGLNNFNKGMTNNGKPVKYTVPSTPSFKPSGIFSVTEDIMVYAFRYALGRQTYAVADVASEIRAHSTTLSKKTRELIIKEIKEAQLSGQISNADEAQWNSTVLALERVEVTGGVQ